MRWIGLWWKIKVNHTLGGERKRKKLRVVWGAIDVLRIREY